MRRCKAVNATQKHAGHNETIYINRTEAVNVNRRWNDDRCLHHCRLARRSAEKSQCIASCTGDRHATRKCENKIWIMINTKKRYLKRWPLSIGRVSDSPLCHLMLIVHLVRKRVIGAVAPAAPCELSNAVYTSVWGSVPLLMLLSVQHESDANGGHPCESPPSSLSCLYNVLSLEHRQQPGIRSRSDHAFLNRLFTATALYPNIEVAHNIRSHAIHSQNNLRKLFVKRPPLYSTRRTHQFMREMYELTVTSGQRPDLQSVWTFKTTFILQTRTKLHLQ